MPERLGIGQPAFAVVVDLLQKSKAWVKLSGAYADTKIGAPTYADSTAVAQAYVKAAPGRLVWGSGWPPVGKGQPQARRPDPVRSPGRMGADPNRAQPHPGRESREPLRPLVAQADPVAP